MSTENIEYGEEYLDELDSKTLERLKERGYEIISIANGFQVYIRKIGSDDEETYGFGEDIGEAIENAFPTSEDEIAPE